MTNTTYQLTDNEIDACAELMYNEEHSESKLRAPWCRLSEQFKNSFRDKAVKHLIAEHDAKQKALQDAISGEELFNPSIAPNIEQEMQKLITKDYIGKELNFEDALKAARYGAKIQPLPRHENELINHWAYFYFENDTLKAADGREALLEMAFSLKYKWRIYKKPEITFVDAYKDMKSNRGKCYRNDDWREGRYMYMNDKGEFIIEQNGKRVCEDFARISLLDLADSNWIACDTIYGE